MKGARTCDRECCHVKESLIFIKNQAGYDDINIFLIQEHFYEKINFLGNQLRVMGSDWDRYKNKNTYLQTKLGYQAKESSRLIKKLPGYDDVNIFLIQEHFGKFSWKIKYFHHQLKVIGSDWDKNKNQNTYLQAT